MGGRKRTLGTRLEVFFLCETIGQAYDVVKSKWRRMGNLKARKGNDQMLFFFFSIGKYYFHIFQRNLKLDCIFNNITLRVVVSFKAKSY